MIVFNKTLHTTSGLTIATGSCTVPEITFSPAVPVEGGGDPIRMMIARIPLHKSQSEFLIDYDGSKVIKGEIEETQLEFYKNMTPAEHAAILADGTLAEVWVQQMIEAQAGIGVGNTSRIDPFA